MGPARMIVESLTTRPGIREQNLPLATNAPQQTASLFDHFVGAASSAGGTARPADIAPMVQNYGTDRESQVLI